MPTVLCPECELKSEERPSSGQIFPNVVEVHCIAKGDYSAGMDFDGVLTCRRDGHRMPIRMRRGQIVYLSPTLPAAESIRLNPNVPQGLQQDIKDAEHAHFFGIYKASAVLARRVVQLGLQEPPNNLPDQPYQKMLADAKKHSPPILSDASYGLAQEIGGYGGKGAHDRIDVTEGEARNAIFTAVRVLNELFP